MANQNFEHLNTITFDYMFNYSLWFEAMQRGEVFHKLEEESVIFSFKFKYLFE